MRFCPECGSLVEEILTSILRLLWAAKSFRSAPGMEIP
jgi:hypothetical protein